MTYRAHGHVPSDGEIERYGYRAFGPARPAFVPTPEDFARALGQCATGDSDELDGVAEELAALWPQTSAWLYWPWGHIANDDQ